MSENILFVKNMVCQRCLLAVENVLERASIKFQNVSVGEICLAGKLSDEQHSLLSCGLAMIGLELIYNKMGGIVEKIKQLLLTRVRKDVKEPESKLKLSAYLSKNLYREYTYLSSLFSSVEGRTIESYFIQQRIEKVKELLMYDEMTLLSISVELEYSSVAHLSKQFKQITGLTPSQFRKISSIKRRSLAQA